MTARVLIVDDIPTNVRLLEARLTAEYFEVRTASSGREALAICADGQVDIVLLDVMMPEMDGFEVCRRLKADAHTAHVPVVMITALDQPSDRVKGLQSGADDFLPKPYRRAELERRVSALLRRAVAPSGASHKNSPPAKSQTNAQRPSPSAKCDPGRPAGAAGA